MEVLIQKYGDFNINLNPVTGYFSANKGNNTDITKYSSLSSKRLDGIKKLIDNYTEKLDADMVLVYDNIKQEVVIKTFASRDGNDIMFSDGVCMKNFYFAAFPYSMLNSPEIENLENAINNCNIARDEANKAQKVFNSANAELQKIRVALEPFRIKL